MSRPKIVVILGPTASGKTALAVSLCKKFSGEVISADSQQVYKYFNLGTAKEGKLIESDDPLGVCRKVNNIPQYLVDFVEPNKQFNLADYQSLAYKKINQIIKSGRIPFLVGGTGLYIEAVTEGYVLEKEPRDTSKIRQDLEKKSTEELFKKLQKLDPESAKNINSNNKRRIVRALEVTILSGIPFSKQKAKTPPPYQFLKLGISKPKDELLESIKKRTKNMLNSGLIEETQEIIKKFGHDLPALASIGYREVDSYLKGEYDKEELADLIVSSTRRYVGRQLTWFKRDKEIIWIKGYGEAEKQIKGFL